MRNEFKYPIRMRDLPALRARLLPYLVPDKNAVTNEHGVYTVRSLYYDTPALSYYHEKIDGISKRRKVRIRVYNTAATGSIAFLEVKHKQRTWVSKSRAPVLAERVEHFMRTHDIEEHVLPLPGFPLAHEHASHFMYYMVSARLRPSALIVYEREAFSGAFDPTFRLTFDHHLRGAMKKGLSNMFEERDLIPYFRDLCVVEVKFSRGLPAWITDILTQYMLRRGTVSKYCLGIDACRARTVSPIA